MILFHGASAVTSLNGQFPRDIEARYKIIHNIAAYFVSTLITQRLRAQLDKSYFYTIGCVILFNPSQSQFNPVLSLVSSVIIESNRVVLQAYVKRQQRSRIQMHATNA